MLAASCSTSEVKTSSSVAVDDYAVTWVTPTGAPTLAFYDQGKNEKWLSTATPASVIPAAFAANSYDAIVFDGVSGLNLVKKNADKTKMRFSRWINELGFYVVSRTHTKEETATWNNAWTIDAFVETGNSSKAFMSLAENVWNWKGLSSTKAETGSKTVTFEAGVSDVAANISTNGFDFYVVADPVYTLDDLYTLILESLAVTLEKISEVVRCVLRHRTAVIELLVLFEKSISYCT